MKNPIECEEIFAEAANLIMDVFSLQSFKKTHPKLFDTIIAAMQVASAVEHKSVCLNEELGDPRCEAQCYQCTMFEKSV